MRRLVATCALAAGALIGSALLAEGLVRWLLPQQLIFYRPDLYAEDERVGWRFRPHLATRVNTGERDILLRTDAFGRRVGESGPERADGLALRGGGSPGRPGRRVLAVGDSFLVGLQVDYADLLTTRLARALGDALGSPVEMRVDAAPGWAPDQYAVEAEGELASGDLDLLLVFLFLGNDIVTRARSSFSADAYRARFDRPLRLPRELSREEIRAAVLVPVNDWLDQRSHLYALVSQRLENLRIRLGLASAALPRELVRAARDGPQWEATADLCARIASSAGQRGVPTLFALLPARYQVDRALFERHARLLGADPAGFDLDQPQRLLGAQLQARGLAFVDATPALREAHATGGAPLYGRVDRHLEPRGHRVVAELLLPSALAALRAASASSPTRSPAGG